MDVLSHTTIPFVIFKVISIVGFQKFNDMCHMQMAIHDAIQMKVEVLNVKSSISCLPSYSQISLLLLSVLYLVECPPQ